ncbi:MAG: DUF4417 domain-containing protein [Clostridia bacterium]|nr:DUF4417 domain-containing protein [Clostridia bacterium]
MNQLSLFDMDVDTVLSGIKASDIRLVSLPNDNIKVNDSVRPGLKDIWNAFMADGAMFGKHDIPFCPTTAKTLPSALITWEEAKAIYKKHIALKKYDFTHDAYVCFYIDDQKFDGPRGIWHDCKQALRVLRHFAGAITPDFSTYQDFPEAIKIYATYRMRLYGYWLGKNGLPVINNVRWGTEETFDYCFEGIPQNSIVAIGTVGGGPRKLINRERFEAGLFAMVKQLQPHTILVYGSARGACFDKLRSRGINIIFFSSKTAQVFEGRE